MITIRPAIYTDLPAITNIYNDAVLYSTATFDTEIKTINDRQKWFENRDENFPIIVATFQETVIGYAALNLWSERKAYNITAETSIYVAHNFRGQGYGKLLIERLIRKAHQTNLNSLLARITEGNEQSINMHKKLGFETVGIMKKVGEKFERKLDVTMLQLMLK